MGEVEHMPVLICVALAGLCMGWGVSAKRAGPVVVGFAFLAAALWASARINGHA